MRTVVPLLLFLLIGWPAFAEPINIFREGYTDAKNASPSYRALRAHKKASSDKPRDYYYSLEIVNLWKSPGGRNALSTPAIFKPDQNHDRGNPKILTAATVGVAYRADLNNQAAAKAYSVQATALLAFSCRRDPLTGADRRANGQEIDFCFVLSPQSSGLPPIPYLGTIGTPYAETFSVEGSLRTTVTNDIPKWIDIGQKIIGLPPISELPGSDFAKAGLDLLKAIDAVSIRDGGQLFSATLGAAGTAAKVNANNEERLSSIWFFDTKQKMGFGATGLVVRRYASLLLDNLPDNELTARDMLRAKVGPIDSYRDSFEKAKSPLLFEESKPATFKNLRNLCEKLDDFNYSLVISKLDGLLLRRSYLLRVGYDSVVSSSEKLATIAAAIGGNVTAKKLQDECWSRDDDAMVKTIAEGARTKVLEKFGSY